MRDIGIRIQSYKLRRYRPPETVGEKARLGLAVVLAAWLIWALFLSDHSAVRLAGLEHKKHSAAANLEDVQRDVERNRRELKSAGDPEVAERTLHERHNFAREDELLYVIQADGSVQAPPRAAAPGDSLRR